jgi:type II secretory pathway pseudopilin PulG
MKHVLSNKKNTPGLSLVEALIVSALITIVFGALFASFQYSLHLISQTRAKTSALSLANDRMEYFRSLSYDDVGTVAGIPSGLIPQNSTTTLNNIEFHERVLVEYVDDPADGVLTATTTDSNGIPADYKRIKIEVSWVIKDTSGSISMVSNIVPRSIETTAGGGTVRVNVLDADAAPLSGASVTLINNTTTTTINVTKSTDATGAALFSGAPAASNYEVIVTAPGYSTDQTYAATTSNPNPTTAPFSVLEADISTMTFQIDDLSDIDILTYSDITDGSITEGFLDASGVASSTDTEVIGGGLRLLQTAGLYALTGEAFLTVAAPSPLLGWGSLTADVLVPSNTSYKIHFYTSSSSSYTLIPDGDLPGNATGFSESVVDISSLLVSTYPSVVVGIHFETTDTSASPSVDELSLYYRESETARSGVALSLHGNKVIGTDLSADPIYKTELSGSTDGFGAVSFSDVEFDTYLFNIPLSLTVARACPLLPLVHEAGVDSSVEIVLVGATTDSLKTTIRAASGEYIPGASVTLSRSGFSETVDTGLCGQAFISSGVAAESDYEITVTKPGFVTEVISNYSISGNGDILIILNPQ